MSIKATASRQDRWLPASVDRTSVHRTSHSGDSARAIADYEHTLDLEPARSSAQNRMAIVLWKQGKRQEAVAHWKSAIAILNNQMNSSQVPETFWTNVRLVINELSSRQLIPEGART